MTWEALRPSPCPRTAKCWPSPSAAARCGSTNGTVRLWDVEAGKSRRTFKEHAGQVHAFAFAADGKALASASFDGTARLSRGYVPDGKEPDEPKLTARELEILLRDLRGDEGA